MARHSKNKETARMDPAGLWNLLSGASDRKRSESCGVPGFTAVHLAFTRWRIHKQLFLRSEIRNKELGAGKCGRACATDVMGAPNTPPTLRLYDCEGGRFLLAQARTDIHVQEKTSSGGHQVAVTMNVGFRTPCNDFSFILELMRM